MNAFQRDLPDASAIDIRPHVGHALACNGRSSRENRRHSDSHEAAALPQDFCRGKRGSCSEERRAKEVQKEFLQSLDDEWNVHASSMEHRDHLDSSSSSSSGDEDGSDARAGADNDNSDANLGGGSEEEECLDEP